MNFFKVCKVLTKTWRYKYTDYDNTVKIFQLDGKEFTDVNSSANLRFHHINVISAVLANVVCGRTRGEVVPLRQYCDVPQQQQHHDIPQHQPEDHLFDISYEIDKKFHFFLSKIWEAVTCGGGQRRRRPNTETRRERRHEAGPSRTVGEEDDEDPPTIRERSRRHHGDADSQITEEHND
ncbi:unnamed protein product [Cochlearia groenlandica]